MIASHIPQHDEREQTLTRALREFDPEALVQIERTSGQLSVSTVLGEREVLTILEGLGVEAAPMREPAQDELHASGGCCGGCGCG